MSKIHFGYVIFDEGKKSQQIRVLTAASELGLENQARYFGLRLRGADYVMSYQDLEDYDEEIEWELSVKEHGVE